MPNRKRYIQNNKEDFDIRCVANVKDRKSMPTYLDGGFDKIQITNVSKLKSIHIFRIF